LLLFIYFRFKNAVPIQFLIRVVEKLVNVWPWSRTAAIESFVCRLIRPRHLALNHFQLPLSKYKLPDKFYKSLEAKRLVHNVISMHVKQNGRKTKNHDRKVKAIQIHNDRKAGMTGKQRCLNDAAQRYSTQLQYAIRTKIWRVNNRTV
jgi:hypothetical protein